MIDYKENLDSITKLVEANKKYAKLYMVDCPEQNCFLPYSYPQDSLVEVREELNDLDHDYSFDTYYPLRVFYAEIPYDSDGDLEFEDSSTWRNEKDICTINSAAELYEFLMTGKVGQLHGTELESLNDGAGRIVTIDTDGNELQVPATYSVEACIADSVVRLTRSLFKKWTKIMVFNKCAAAQLEYISTWLNLIKYAEPDSLRLITITVPADNAEEIACELLLDDFLGDYDALISRTLWELQYNTPYEDTVKSLHGTELESLNNSGLFGLNSEQIVKVFSNLIEHNDDLHNHLYNATGTWDEVELLKTWSKWCRNDGGIYLGVVYLYDFGDSAEDYGYDLAKQANEVIRRRYQNVDAVGFITLWREGKICVRVYVQDREHHQSFSVITGKAISADQLLELTEKESYDGPFENNIIADLMLETIINNGAIHGTELESKSTNERYSANCERKDSDGNLAGYTEVLYADSQEELANKIIDNVDLLEPMCPIVIMQDDPYFKSMPRVIARLTEYNLYSWAKANTMDGKPKQEIKGTELESIDLYTDKFVCIPSCAPWMGAATKEELAAQMKRADKIVLDDRFEAGINELNTNNNKYYTQAILDKDTWQLWIDKYCSKEIPGTELESLCESDDEIEITLDKDGYAFTGIHDKDRCITIVYRPNILYITKWSPLTDLQINAFTRVLKSVLHSVNVVKVDINGRTKFSIKAYEEWPEMNLINDIIESIDDMYPRIIHGTELESLSPDERDARFRGAFLRYAQFMDPNNPKAFYDFHINGYDKLIDRFVFMHYDDTIEDFAEVILDISYNTDSEIAYVTWVEYLGEDDPADLKRRIPELLEIPIEDICRYLNNPDKDGWKIFQHKLNKNGAKLLLPDGLESHSQSGTELESLSNNFDKYGNNTAPQSDATLVYGYYSEENRIGRMVFFEALYTDSLLTVVKDWINFIYDEYEASIGVTIAIDGQIRSFEFSVDPEQQRHVVQSVIDYIKSVCKYDDTYSHKISGTELESFWDRLNSLED